MRQLLITLIFALLCQAAWASPFFVFNHKVFYIPNEGPVVETYIEFHGKTVIMSPNPEGFLTGLLEITTIFRQGEEVITFDKKILETPWMTPDDIIDFLDVQRFKIAPGQYTVEIRLNDLNKAESTGVEFEMDIAVPEPETGLFFSDIEMVMGYKKSDSTNIYTKSGYDLLPMVSDDYMGVNMNELMFYSELYNSDQLGEDEKFLLNTFIAHAETGDAMPETQKFERRSSGMVVPILSKVNISELKSGDYYLVIEARDRQNEILARKEHAFTRNFKGKALDLRNIADADLFSSWVNLYDNKEELFEHIQSTRPITDPEERFAMEGTFENIFAVELSQLQRYFLAFWEKREPNNSENAWLAYKEKVEFVEKEFGTRNKRGYETDRGRVYLQYGPPVDITLRENEPSSYPYHIWRYYKADRFNNVRFIFFDPQLTGRDYILLHCERIPGEIRNPQWRILLQQRTTPVIGVDDRQTPGTFGSRVDDFFENPR